MTLFGIDLLGRLRQRMGGLLAALAGSVACCVCGAMMAFVFAPGQALRASQIAGLPQIDAAALEAAAAGETVLITGVLSGNSPLLDGYDLVAYSEEEWQVSVNTTDPDGPSTPSGRWQSLQTVVPELSLDMSGQVIQLQAATSARLSGPLHEAMILGGGALEADYMGDPLPDGTRRFKGLSDGDMTTVLGKKAASNAVAPEQLFLGDRAAFETSQRQAASGLLYSGICSMLMAPVVLIGGLLGVIFWRR
jgi:hypothetical protein